MRKLMLLLGFLLVACQGEGEAAGPSRASVISCTAVYRSGVSMPIATEEMVTLDDENGQSSLTFADLAFHAQYNSGEADHERALHLSVTEPGQTEFLIAQLYQMPLDSGPQDQFVGGHGFTGLNYVYNPTSGAELQYWCVAEN